MQFFSIGSDVGLPFGRKWNAIGLGYAVGEPSDISKRNEQIVEIYWRFQLIPYIALAHDFQWIIDPANDPQQNRITVIGAAVGGVPGSLAMPRDGK